MVFLKLRPHVQQSVASCICLKLSPRYYDHFSVEVHVGEVAYKLALLASSRFHSILPTELEPTVYFVWEPLAVLALMDIFKGGETVTHVLVH
jgi:hypothetical protein